MKRKFSLFMAVTCLASCLSFSGIAHAAGTSSFTDVTSGHQYNKAIVNLTKLGVINGYDNGDGTFSFKPEGDITRAEFTKIITVALGIADTASAGSVSFNDVEGHWAKSNIIAASSRGIVNGFPEDNTFRPDEKVTYEQAVKMIVCSAGYETAAQALGGWPNGYMAQANTLGITKGAVSTNQSGAATRGVVAQLMYNVLNVDIPVINPATGRMEDDLDTFLETYLGVVQEKAKVVGVEDKVTADCSQELYEGEMAILTTKGRNLIVLDYTTYTDDASALEDLLGQEVVVYYKEGKGADIDTLFEIDTETVKNSVVTINSKDIDSFSGTTLKYYDENDKLKSISISDDEVSALYYNGAIVEDDIDEYIDSWLSPSNDEFIYGEVKLTDSGDDGSVDIIDIMDYEFLVASRTPSTSDYIVTNKVKFKNGNPEGYIQNIELDPENVHYTCNITDASGKKMNVTSIKANDVLLIAESLDGEVINVKVNSKSVSGKVSGFSSGENEITISDKDYPISDYAQQYFDENNIEIKTSLQATFYVDVYGTIVYGSLSTSSTSSNYSYAYIIRATMDDDDESNATIKAFVASSNSIKTFPISGKIKYNGSNVSVSDVVERLRQNSSDDDYNVIVPDDELDDFEVKTTNACQVARILVEGSSLTEIYTVDAEEAYNDGDWGVQTESPTAVIPYQQFEGTTKYSQANNFGTFFVNSSTTYIYVPQDRSSEGYSKKSISYYSVGANAYVQPYNVNNSKIADLVIIYGKSTTASTKPTTSTHVYVAAEDANLVDAGDDEIYEIPTFANSKTLSTGKAELENLDTKDKGYIDIADLKVGDLYRVGRNGNYYANCELAIAYEDVLEVLEDGTYDFTVKDDDGNEIFEWFSSSSASSAYGRLYVANIVDVVEDGDQYMVRTTRNGFTDGELDEGTEELIYIDGNTIILKINEKKNEVITTYDDDSSEALTALDLRSAEEFGDTCSKVAVYEYSTNPTKGRDCKMILIYE